jgi:hypothetical protein
LFTPAIIRHVFIYHHKAATPVEIFCSPVRLSGIKPLLSMSYALWGNEENEVHALFLCILQSGWGKKLGILGSDSEWQCGHTGWSARFVTQVYECCKNLAELASFTANPTN